RRSEQTLADDAHAPRTLRTRVLLVEDDLLRERQPAPAVLRRPRHARPARGAQCALPREALLEQRVLVTGTTATAHDRELPSQLIGQPFPSLSTKGLVLGRKPQIHCMGA